ncbi:MAG: putative DNA-binding mobile mystery protein A [Parasphingorhabdus sp.]|jgi:predicted DNA-binding mobile mystery protein A
MKSQDRVVARRQIDRRLRILRDEKAIARPPRGWIRAIREALGMTTAQLGTRMGVSQPRAFAIEKAEENRTLTLETLEKAARALECHLVYALVPREPLEDLLRKRACKLATRKLETTGHSMKLEAQGVNMEDEDEQLKRLIEKLIEKSGSELWEKS